jgi:hypothetical protein
MPLEQDEVVAVDQFRLVEVAEKGLDFRAGLACDAARFRTGVIDQAAGDFMAV